VISSPDTTARIRHAGPPLGIVAAIFVVLFNAGLYPVPAFGGNPVFPGSPHEFFGIAFWLGFS
jgi:hypothetical protein